MDDKHIWLNHPKMESVAHPNHRPPDWLRVAPRTFDPRYPYAFYERLHRDGWRIDQDWWRRYAPLGFTSAPRAWHEKAHPGHQFSLVMESDIFYRSESPSFAVQDSAVGDLRPLEGATWADWDHRGRMFYAKDGKLFAAEVDSRGLGGPAELADFNGSRPQPREAASWAREW